MYSLIFTSCFLTAFGITLVDKNYLFLKLRFQREYKLRMDKNENHNYFTTRYKHNILSCNNKPFSHDLWYWANRGFPTRFLKLHMLVYLGRQADVERRDSNASEINCQRSKYNNEVLSTETKSLPISPLKPNEIDFVRYHSLDKMHEYLNSLQWKYPHIINIDSIGKSFENRDIKLIKVSTGNVGTKTTMLIVGGMNSNEWISPATVLYCIQQLVENPVNNYMLGKADWLFIPLTNPDGYEYSYKENLKWKKTRSYGSTSHECVGVNLNKNCDYRCDFTSSGNNSCSDFYAGTKPFSEQEAKALLDLITRGVQIQLFVNINNYGQSLEFPLDNAKKFIQDSSDLQYLAEKASYAVHKYGGRKYAIKGFNSCGSEQWVRREGIKYSYNLKLPLENKQSSNSQVPESDILPIAQEVFVVFRELQQVLVSIYSVTYDLISED